MMTDQETNEAVAKKLRLTVHIQTARQVWYEEFATGERSNVTYNLFEPCGDKPENLVAAVWAIKRICSQAKTAATMSIDCQNEEEIATCVVGGSIGKATELCRAICEAIIGIAAETQPEETAVAG